MFFFGKKILSVLCALAVLFGAVSVWALDSLTVGMNVGGRRWDDVADTSSLMVVTRDSIWTWDVEVGGNLSLGAETRQGGAFTQVEDALRFTPLPEGQVMLDGDTGSAFDPDEAFEVERTTPLMVDMGGAFRINRVRIFPRLDRDNQRRFIQEFTLSASMEVDGPYQTIKRFFPSNPNFEPLLDMRFDALEARYVRLEPTVNREWEMAEFEIYGDGSVPVGEFVSIPLMSSTRKVWGRVRYEGGDIRQLPVKIQTRTGPDARPILYFMKKGEELISVRKHEWEGALEGLKGPVRINPDWTSWENLEEGQVRSPGNNRYLQFRVRMPEPGTKLKRLIFDYSKPPIAKDMAAEINPTRVAPGEEVEFTLSMEVRLEWRFEPPDSGFRELQVLTQAQIGKVERVLVDDVEVPFGFNRLPGEGFRVLFARRVAQNGSFVQIVFRGAMFQARNQFEIRAVDQRVLESGRRVQAYQIAREADVEPKTVEASLTVQLEENQEELPLFIKVEAVRAFTPNEDGINDRFAISYGLLKLLEPASVSLLVYDLGGRRVAQVDGEGQGVGLYALEWDGRDRTGRLVPPGIYLYELRAETDKKVSRQRGTVGVAY
ncbi:MAG: hypothetical protein HOC74_15795 [Gemmatimonadetes bacterium]|nr:hypothetical protein [Gemmatimonadota bacterium]